MRKIFRNCSRYIIGYVFIALLSTAITVGVNLLNRSILNRLVQDTAGGSLSGASLGLAVSYIAAWLSLSFQNPICILRICPHIYPVRNIAVCQCYRSAFINCAQSA